MSQLRNILGLREEIEIYNVGPGQGADIIIFRFIVIDLSSLVSLKYCRPAPLLWSVVWCGLMLQQCQRAFDLPEFSLSCQSGLFMSQEDWLTDWLILIKLFVVDKLICPSVTHISHRKHCKDTNYRIDHYCVLYESSSSSISHLTVN